MIFQNHNIIHVLLLKEYLCCCFLISFINISTSTLIFLMLNTIVVYTSKFNFIIWMLPSCIRQIQSFNQKPWTLSFRHVYREANQCADRLAKKGSSSSDLLVTWPSCPSPLRSLLLADALKVPTLRL